MLNNARASNDSAAIEPLLLGNLKGSARVSLIGLRALVNIDVRYRKFVYNYVLLCNGPVY